MDDKIRTLLESEEIQPPASEASLLALAEYVRVMFGTRLPNDYWDFLTASDGYDGDVGGKSYIRLWPAVRVPSDNAGYESQRWMPGFLMIGDNGGNAVFGIDLRAKDPDAAPYVETDFVPMSWDDTFGRDASLYDFLQRRVALHDDEDAEDSEE